MSVKWTWCSNLSRWDFFYTTLCMLHDTWRKPLTKLFFFWINDNLNGPSCGHLNDILARVGGNLNNNIINARGVAWGGGCWSFDLTDTICMSLVWISTPIILHYWGGSYVAVGILQLYLFFSLSMSWFQPIFVLFFTISAVLCHCFKAMLLVRIHTNRASVYACLLVTAVYLDGFKWGIHSRLCSKENWRESSALNL